MKDPLVSEIVVGGTYQHYKNKKIYQVIGIAQHTETEEKMVVYTRYTDGELDSHLWVRPKKMFEEHVMHEGVSVPRFGLITKNPTNAVR